MTLTTPRGMRDVLPEEALWRERIVAAVSGRFAAAGYLPVETPVLEERDLLTDADAAPEATFRLFDGDGRQLMLRPDVTLPIARLVSSRLRGQAGPFRLRYAAPVFCERDALRGQARQFTQLGIELIGQAGVAADAEVLSLAMGALDATGLGGYVVALGSVRPFEALLAACGMDAAWRAQAWEACRTNDLVGLDALVDAAGSALAPEMRRALRGLPRVHGGRAAIDAARALVEPCVPLLAGASDAGTCADAAADPFGLDELAALLDAAQAGAAGGVLTVDFSLTGSFGYYTGVVFAAYLPGLGTCLGSGGRYDRVFERYGAARPAAGFALSLDALQTALDRAPQPQPAGEGTDGLVALASGFPAGSVTPVRAAVTVFGVAGASAVSVPAPAAPASADALTAPLASGFSAELVALAAPAPAASASAVVAPAAVAPATPAPAPTPAVLRRRPLRIALSKGSLYAGALDLLARAGLDTSRLEDPGRQLIIAGPNDVEYIIVRPTDAPAFVAFGGADCGICGKDSLFEANLDVLELADLHYGGCRFVVAEPAAAQGRAEENYRRLGSIRVATKYPRITRAYYARIGVTADILKFHGNIELAPLVGMADRIVDITATGTTLRENNLVIVDEVMRCTARFFANPASARTNPRVYEMAHRLELAAAEKEEG